MPARQSPPSLQKSIDRLSALVNKQTSLTHLFLRSVVGGVGYALGASLVAGLVVIWIGQIIRTIDYVPFIQELVSSQEIQDAFREAMDSATPRP